MNLSLLTSSVRGMQKAHVMCKGMDHSTMLRRQVLRKNQCFWFRVGLEHCKLCIVFQSSRVIHVDIWSCRLSVREWRGRVPSLRESRQGDLTVKLVLCNGSMLFLELASSFPLFPLNALSFCKRKHLLVFDSELSAAQLHVVQSLDDLLSLIGTREVGEGQSAEDTIIEVVIESIWQRQVHVDHQFNKLLLLDSEGNVLDHDGCRNKFIIVQ